MPNYQFHCEFCNTDHTITKRMSEYDPNELCPTCSEKMSRKVEDLISNYQECKGFYGKSNN